MLTRFYKDSRNERTIKISTIIEAAINMRLSNDEILELSKLYEIWGLSYRSYTCSTFDLVRAMLWELQIYRFGHVYVELKNSDQTLSIIG